MITSSSYISQRALNSTSLGRELQASCDMESRSIVRKMVEYAGAQLGCYSLLFCYSRVRIFFYLY
jgi:hypothetical protein